MPKKHQLNKERMCSHPLFPLVPHYPLQIMQKKNPTLRSIFIFSVITVISHEIKSHCNRNVKVYLFIFILSKLLETNKKEDNKMCIFSGFY